MRSSKRFRNNKKYVRNVLKKRLLTFFILSRLDFQQVNFALLENSRFHPAIRPEKAICLIFVIFPPNFPAIKFLLRPS